MNIGKSLSFGIGIASLLCGLASAQTFTRLIGAGDIIVGGEPGETVTRVDNVEINNNGDWAVEVDGSGDPLSDAYTLVNGVQVVLFDSPEATATPPEGAAMGVLYVVATLLAVGGSLAGLMARYRRVSP